MRFLSYVLVSITTLCLYNLWQKMKYERFSMRLTAKKLIIMGLLIIGLGTFFDFDANRAERMLDDGDEQLGEYYGSMRSKYIKFMGFDYDHVKFDEIGKDLKADPAPKEKSVEQKKVELKEDIKDDAPREVKELVPEEEEIEENVKQDAAELAAVAESMNKEPQAAGDRANHADLMISAKNQPDIPKDDPRLPKFIVVGVMKCGTGATQHFLHNHPDLQQAKQETYFFNNDHKYLELGYDWYLNLYRFPTHDGQMNYEKTPTYYKSVRAQPRIKAMNETVKLVNIVCDNVRRTLSRFLHLQHGVGIEKFKEDKLDGFGHTLDEFNRNLKITLKKFGDFLEDVKQNEGHGTMEGLVNALLVRFKRRMRPFGIHATKDPIELILSDGFYAVFHQRWMEVFPKEQMLVLDGSKYLTEPWIPLKAIQQYIGVQEYITKDNFMVNPGGLPCFIEPGKSKEQVDCLGSGKGRTLDKRFHKEVTLGLHKLFQPFDDYFAKKVLGRPSFGWDFGLDSL
ncbi:Oidioi.mRNA.OKI2018_I69.chr2.g4077.t1.cds [Oikopleura dioica]|uniref:Sulfotransferase n=1 Tax=Oikopleura dioica TaxID=34765 RepID=A0ABN7SW10_OIKDI|nr:Oidioi.mRNA.OKI2018_I69.chr2.g4077.t1.cds [Oikopleura dioica]